MFSITEPYRTIGVWLGLNNELKITLKGFYQMVVRVQLGQTNFKLATSARNICFGNSCPGKHIILGDSAD